MQSWFADHPIIAYIVIFILLTYVYNRVCCSCSVRYLVEARQKRKAAAAAKRQ